MSGSTRCACSLHPVLARSHLPPALARTHLPPPAAAPAPSSADRLAMAPSTSRPRLALSAVRLAATASTVGRVEVVKSTELCGHTRHHRHATCFALH